MPLSITLKGYRGGSFTPSSCYLVDIVVIRSSSVYSTRVISEIKWTALGEISSLVVST